MDKVTILFYREKEPTSSIGQKCYDTKINYSHKFDLNKCQGFMRTKHEAVIVAHSKLTVLNQEKAQTSHKSIPLIMYYVVLSSHIISPE